MYITEAIENNMRNGSLVTLREQGTALETELGAPLRILSARQRPRSLEETLTNDWSGRSGEPRHYETADSTDDLREKGITFFDYSWNSDDFGESRPTPTIIGQRRRQDYNGVSEHAFFETITPSLPNWNHFVGNAAGIESGGGKALTFAGQEDHLPYGAVYGGRVIYYGYNINELSQYGEINWDFLFFHAVREQQDPEFRARLLLERQARTAVAFTELLKIRGGQAADELRDRIGTLATRIGESQEKLVNDSGEINALGRQLNAILADEENTLDETAIAAEWEKINEFAHVESIRISEEPAVNEFGEQLEDGRTNHKMIVRTDLLWIEHPDTGRKVPLGEFDLELNFGMNTTRINNRTMQQGRNEARWDHPHVKEGILCAGEFSSTITTMLRQHNISGMLGLIFNVLKVVTIRDEWGGANMPLWIKADDNLREKEGWSAWTEDEEIHPMLANNDTGGDA